MFAKTLAAAVLAACTTAQSQETKDKYPDYTAEFDKWNIEWEPIEIKTKDGWTLTMFHVTGTPTRQGPATRNPVIFQHGMGGQGLGWTYSMRPANMPMAFQMADRGYDVFLTNNSGVEYSQKNDYYTIDQPEYWAMDWSKYGVYDLPAAVEYIRAGQPDYKVALVGHSQGTTQTFAGMAQIPDWYDENISVAVQMGPCTSPNQKYFKDMYTKENWDCLQRQGVFVFAGPNWDEQLPKIKENCPALADTIDTLTHLPNNPVQACAAYAQTSLSSRFQKYTDTWFDNEDEYPKTELLDFGLTKKMKIVMNVGLFDNTCPLTTAVEQKAQMGDSTVAKWTVAPWQGHVPWGFSAAPWFINDLDENLSMNQHDDDDEVVLAQN